MHDDDVVDLRESLAKGFLQVAGDLVRVDERSCASAVRAYGRNPTDRRLQT